MILIVAIVRFFGIEGEVATQLDSSLQKDIRTEQYICDRLRSSIAILKSCQSEEDRQVYGAILTSVAPIDQNRISCVCARLGVKRNRRPIHMAIARAKAIEEAKASQMSPIGVGSAVTCKAGDGVVVACDNEGNCDVEIIMNGDQKHTVRCRG